MLYFLFLSTLLCFVALYMPIYKSDTLNGYSTNLKPLAQTFSCNMQTLLRIFLALFLGSLFPQGAGLFEFACYISSDMNV